MHNASTSRQITESAKRILANNLDRLTEIAVNRSFASEPNYHSIGLDSMREKMRKNLQLILMRISGDPIPPEIADAAYATGRDRAAQRVKLAAITKSYRIDLRLVWEAFLDDAKRHNITVDNDYISELLRVWEAVESSITEMSEAYQVTSEKLKKHTSDIKTAAFQRIFSLGESGNHASFAKQVSLLSLNPEKEIMCLVSNIHESSFAELSNIHMRLEESSKTHHFGWHNQQLVGFIQAGHSDLDNLREIFKDLSDHSTALVAVYDVRDLFTSIVNARTLLRVKAKSPGIHFLEDNWLEVMAESSSSLTNSLIAQIFGGFEDLTDHTQHELIGILEGYFATNGTLSEIAAKTFRHRNTVRNRLNQVEELTGLSLNSPKDIALLALAFSIWKTRFEVPPSLAEQISGGSI